MTVFDEAFKVPFKRPFISPFLSGGFTPAQIFGLEAWYDCSDVSTIDSTGGLVNTLSDKSGNGNELAAGGVKPETDTTTINERNVVAFDGSSGEFLAASGFLVEPGCTTFVVCRPLVSTNANDAVYSFAETGGNGDYQLDSGMTGSFLAMFQSTDLGFTSEVKDPEDRLNEDILIRVALRTDTNSVELGINGAVVASDGGYNQSMDNNMIFRVGTNRGASQELAMLFAEFIHYNQELTIVEINEVEDYLIAKWGIKRTFTPAQINGLEGWYDASDLSTINETANAVNELNDKSGNTNTLTAAVGEEPTTNTETMNGNNVLVFDGTELLARTAFPVTQGNTTFIVCRVTTPLDNSNDSVYSFNGDDGDYQVDSEGTGSFFDVRVQVSDLGIGNRKGSNVFGTDVIIRLEWKASTGDFVLAVDGVQVDSSSNYNSNMSASMILHIAGNRGGGAKIGMHFAEFVHYNKELTSIEITEVETYLMDKWGI